MAVAGSGMATAALMVVGVLLVVFGLFGGNLPLIALGIVALIAGGVLQVWSQRRT